MGTSVRPMKTKWVCLVCILGTAILLFVSSCIVGPPVFDEPAWRRDVEDRKAELLYGPHYKDGRFFNPWMPMEEKGFGRFLRWKFSRKADYTDEEKSFAPRFVPNLRDRIQNTAGDFIAWIGHGTFLMRINGEFWLTDPMFSDRALIIRRKIPPAVTAEDIQAMGGKLNVVVSHNHYDHFDKASIKALPEQTRVFVPLGLKKTVLGLKKRDVREMDWWDAAELGNGVRIVCLPAQHWSKRISQPTNSTLWASWLIITPGVTVYYGGDSGYFIGYKEIGRRFPGIDYALLPVTAYTPRWFMHYAHVDAAEALDSFADLGAKKFIPTQWGTFHLGDEPPGYPMVDLKKKIVERDIGQEKIIIMDVGQIHSIRKKTAAD